MNMPRSSFDLSHPYKTTFDADDLVPICEPIDIIPGSTFKWATSFYIRLQTPLHAILDNMYFDTFAFFVPYRLIWDNHEKFHGAQDNPGDSIDFTIPSDNVTISVGDVGDYMGLVTGVAIQGCSVMPGRAYFLIYNNWFRDENLQNSLTVDTGNGHATNVLNQPPLKRGKRFDYFTSSLPTPQKGSAVSMPLGTTAPITSTAAAGADLIIDASAANEFRIGAAATFATAQTHSGTVNVFVDLANATAANVNDVRLAFQTQRLLERDMRAGTRYVEALASQWGTTSPDHRLQRAEFLGSGSTRINITPVAQTSGQAVPATDDELGAVGGFGTANGTHSWTQSFVEHGVVIILGNVRGDITYSQGNSRYWTKSTRYDFVYPVLAQIGEQAVRNGEIYYDNTAADDLTWGFQERYAEHRYIPGRCTGLMRPDVAGTLATWNLTEEFLTRPALGATFIEANLAVPLDRAIGVPSQPQFKADFYHQVRAALPLPLFGVPGNMDRL